MNQNSIFEETYDEWQYQKERKLALRQQGKSEFIQMGIDCYEYEINQPTPTYYDGVLFHSQLEARWAAFFNQGVMHEWDYEPEKHPFYGWLPDFAVLVRSTDSMPVWCEVKPLRFRQFPQEIADKILSAEPQRDNNLIVAILGLDCPVWLDRLPSLGWISLRKRNGERVWHPFSVSDSTTATYRWKKAEKLTNNRGFVSAQTTMISLLAQSKQNLFNKKRRDDGDDLPVDIDSVEISNDDSV